MGVIQVIVNPITAKIHKKKKKGIHPIEYAILGTEVISDIMLVLLCICQTKTSLSHFMQLFNFP